jgi:hypothetical protein
MELPISVGIPKYFSFRDSLATCGIFLIVSLRAAFSKEPCGFLLIDFLSRIQ